MRWILTAILLCALPLLAADASVVGDWSVEVRDTPQGLFNCELKFQTDGDKLSGEKTCNQAGPFDLADIKLDGKDLSFTVNAGQRVVTIKVEVKGDSLEGTWELESGTSGPYVGKRK